MISSKMFTCQFFPSVIMMVFLLAVTTDTVNAATPVLKAEQWEVNRTGTSVVTMPVLNRVVNNWIKRYEAQPDVSILLHYPGGEEGEIWVQELADWLVSLGVPSGHIVIVPGSGSDDKITLSLE